MKSELTQIARTEVSAPTRFIVDNCYLFGKVLHFGEGKAYADTTALDLVPGVDYVQPYDPNSPEEWKRDRSVLRGCQYDIVVSNYVLNTLTAAERQDAFMESFYAGCRAYITVRIDKVKGEPFQDGVITSRGTFQTQLSAAEWVCWFYDILNTLTVGRHNVRVLNNTRSYLMVEVW